MFGAAQQLLLVMLAEPAQQEPADKALALLTWVVFGGIVCNSRDLV
jgi:hypothetical protein